MDEIGIDLSKHKPKTFDDLQDTSYDLIISLSPEAQHQAVELTRTMACEVEFWTTFDPSLLERNRETRLQAYRYVRDWLTRRIQTPFTLALQPPTYAPAPAGPAALLARGPKSLTLPGCCVLDRHFLF